MNKSESIKALAAALTKAQSEIRNTPASKTNPHFQSRYTPLDDVLATVRPVLSNHGLSVIQSVSGASDTISVVTAILHESGEWIESDPLTMKADKMTPQGQGSAITYGRRYSLSAMLGIATDPDDDGNEAEPKPPPKPKTESQPTEPPSAEPPKVITPDDLKEITARVMDKDGKPLHGEVVRFQSIYQRYGYKEARDILKRDWQQIRKEFIDHALPANI